MAALLSSEVKYGTPLVTKLGPFLFTATVVEFPSGAEASTGGVELKLSKLGLTDELVLGNVAEVAEKGAAGETATTSALPVAAWSTPSVKQSEAAKGELIATAHPTTITIESKKLFLRFLAVKAVKEPMQESSTAEKAETGKVSLEGCTVFVIGK